MVKNKNQANTRHHNRFWDVQLAKSEAAMTEKSFQDVITLTTGSLDKLMETHVLRLLELRSTAYENKGLLSRALEDATQMIQYVPVSPSGYLRAGCVLMTHGKPSLAVDSYKKGLHAIPQSHHLYKQMKNECDKAVIRAQKRFDIVGRLSRELVYKVLINLDPERVWVCLKVSKRWCEQVSRCGTWWSTVTVKQTGTEIDQAVCDAIPLVKDYIEQLELENLSSSDLNKKYLAHLKYGIFTNIKMLSLKGAFFQELCSEDLAIALWQIRGTLTSLKVDFGSVRSFPLLMILGSCPDITELCYTTAGDIQVWNNGNGYGSGCRRLSNLELCCYNITYSTLRSNLAVCPNICRLILMSSGTQVLSDFDSTSFRNHCPNLKIFGLNCREGLPDVDDCVGSTDRKGVAYISIELDHHTNSYQTTKYIAEQSLSLQHLNIVHRYYNAHQHYPVSNELPTTYGELVSLKYSYYNTTSNWHQHQYYDHRSGIQQFVGTVIQRSPALVDLSLFGAPYVSTYIRTPLEQATKDTIRALTLTSVSFQNTDTFWYNSFLSSMNSVHSLVLQNIDLSSDKLSSLAKSQSIQQLTIIKCTGVTSEALTEFFKCVALLSTHQLNTLHINDLPISLDDSAMRFLIRIHGLKTFRITNCNNIYAAPINYLIACAPTSPLKTIEVLDCFPTDIAVSWSDAVDSLKKKGVTLVIE